MKLIGSPGVELVVFSEDEAVLESTVYALGSLREGTLRARHSHRLERVRDIRVDTELSFVVHSECVHVASR